MRTADTGELVALLFAIAWLVLAFRARRARHGAEPGRSGRTSVLVAAGTGTVLFAGQAVLSDVVVDAGGGPIALDTAVWTSALSHRTALLTAVAQALDTAAGTVSLGLLAAVSAGVLWLLRHRLEAVVVLAAAGGAAGLIVAFKTVYARSRPPLEGRLITETGFSLPSGHALGAAAVLGALALVVASLGRRRRVTWGVAVPAGVMVAAAGASRVYLGVHWLSDIVAGWLLGGAWAAVCAVALLVLRPDRAPVQPGERAVARPGGQGASSR